MPYKGPPIVCEQCGQTFTRPPSLRRHLAQGRCPGRGSSRPAALIPARPKAEPVRAAESKVLDVIPIRSEIVPAGRAQAPERLRSGDAPPPWWFPGEADRRKRWQKLTPEYRAQIERDHQPKPDRGYGLPGEPIGPLAIAPDVLKRPAEADAVTLREQYHVLKALAVRLDAGRGTERDRVMFEAWLREYNANYDRIRAQRKARPNGET